MSNQSDKKLGWFRWGFTNLTQSAKNIALEHTDQGPKLTADLPMTDGGSRGRQGMFLGDKIENRDGHLKFVVSRAYCNTWLPAIYFNVDSNVVIV